MTRVKTFVADHVILTFLVMGMCFGASALSTFNLLYLFKANLMLFLDYGAMVVGDGALQQLLELIGYGYLGLGSYLLFKICEHALVDHFLAGTRHPEYRD